MDLTRLVPGDLVVRDACPTYDADVPALVLACERSMSPSRLPDLYRYQCHVLLLYCCPGPVLKQLTIDSHDAGEYRTLTLPEVTAVLIGGRRDL